MATTSVSQQPTTNQKRNDAIESFFICCCLDLRLWSFCLKKKQKKKHKVADDNRVEAEGAHSAGLFLELLELLNGLVDGLNLLLELAQLFFVLFLFCFFGLGVSKRENVSMGGAKLLLNAPPPHFCLLRTRSPLDCLTASGTLVSYCGWFMRFCKLSS